MRVALQAVSGQYVAAEANGGHDIRADRSAAGLWEQFDLTVGRGGCLESGGSVFLHTSAGFYFSAAGGGGSTLDATGTSAGPRERFLVHRSQGPGPIYSGDFVTLQAASGHFVVAVGGGGVRADGTDAGSWGTFRITAVDLQ